MNLSDWTINGRPVSQCAECSPLLANYNLAMIENAQLRRANTNYAAREERLDSYIRQMSDALHADVRRWKLVARIGCIVSVTLLCVLMLVVWG